MDIKEVRYTELQALAEKFAGLQEELLACTTPDWYAMGCALQYLTQKPTAKQQAVIDAGTTWIASLIAAGFDATKALAQQAVVAGKDFVTAWKKELTARKEKREQNAEKDTPSSLDKGIRLVKTTKGRTMVYDNHGETWSLYGDYVDSDHVQVPWLACAQEDFPDLAIDSKTRLLKVVQAWARDYKNKSGKEGLQFAIEDGFEQSAGNANDDNMVLFNQEQREEFSRRLANVAIVGETVEPVEGETE